MITELEIQLLEEICGGDNFNDCLTGLGASVGVIGTAATLTGPIGWVTFGALVGAAATAGYATGWSCSAWYREGN